MQNPNARLPRRGSMMDAYVRPLGPLGLGGLGGMFVPRALPWAITVRPVGALRVRTLRIGARKKRLRDNFFDHIPSNIGQPKVSAGIAIG